MTTNESVLRSGPDIFLSYRRTDRPFVEQLVSVVEGLGPSVWWDAEIEGGEDWRDSIVENLSASRCLVIVFSEACNSSKQLRKELAVADHLNKEVIPVLIEPTEPRGFFLYELAPLNWINLHPAPADKLDAVARALVERLETEGWTAVPVIAPDPAVSPELSAPVDDAEAADVSPDGQPVLATTTPAATAGEAVATSQPDAALAPPTLPPPAPPSTARAGPAPAPPTSRPGLREVFPFRWKDFILPALLGVAGFFAGEKGDSVAVRIGNALFLFIGVLALTGLIVFPIRYYRRRANPYRVARNLVISNIVFALAGVLAGFMMADTLRDEGESLGEARAYFSIGIFVLALFVAAISFAIFFVLSRIRAKRAYRQGNLQL